MQRAGSEGPSAGPRAWIRQSERSSSKWLRLPNPLAEPVAHDSDADVSIRAHPTQAHERSPGSPRSRLAEVRP